MLDFGSETQDIIEIVFTGGSCAGKTTALTLVAHSLREKGYSVLAVPEAVTMLVSSGIPDIGEISRHDLYRGCQLQREVFSVQRALRRSYRGLAKLFSTPKVIILYDRGELDALAYHKHECIAGYAAEEGTNLDDIRNSYTGIMHLVTAANGALSAYSAFNNTARWDTPEEACRSDQEIYKQWEGNPNHIVIDNSTDFIGKMERLIEATMDIAGPPHDVEPKITITGGAASVKPNAERLPI